MLIITAPDPKPGRSRFLDVDFTDGVAEVPDLHPVRAAALIQHGYTVAEIVVGIPLEDLTKRDLLDIAATEGIDVPRKATKAQIIALIEAHPGIPVLE